MNPSTLSELSQPLLRQVLNDRYLIGDRVGVGGMATVLHARDLRLDRMVAIKVLHPHLAANASFLARFQREAQLAAALPVHPNIVTIHDVGNDGDVHYMVMELVPSVNLKELLARESPLRVAPAFEIGAQITSALDLAHAHQLVHRDIKPQNIMVDGDGHIKVTDFGIARPMDGTELTGTGTVIGSAAYMSPEQALGKPVGRTSDIYSLGVVLYEMLAGRLPFEADNALEMAMHHVRDEPLAPNLINGGIPPGPARLVMRAMAKKPEDRYQSAAEMREGMQRIVAQYGQRTSYIPLPCQTPVISPSRTARELTRLPPSRRLRPRLLGLLVPLVVGGSLAAWLLLGSGSGPTRHAPRSPFATAVPPAARVSHPARARPPAGAVLPATSGGTAATRVPAPTSAASVPGPVVGPNDQPPYGRLKNRKGLPPGKAKKQKAFGPLPPGDGQGEAGD